MRDDAIWVTRAFQGLIKAWMLIAMSWVEFIRSDVTRPSRFAEPGEFFRRVFRICDLGIIPFKSRFGGVGGSVTLEMLPRTCEYKQGEQSFECFWAPPVSDRRPEMPTETHWIILSIRPIAFSAAGHVPRHVSRMNLSALTLDSFSEVVQNAGKHAKSIGDQRLQLNPRTKNWLILFVYKAIIYTLYSNL